MHRAKRQRPVPVVSNEDGLNEDELEEQLKSKSKSVRTTRWGRSAKSYYNADESASELDEDSDKEVLEEAKQIRKQRFENVAGVLDDFALDFYDTPDATEKGVDSGLKEHNDDSLQVISAEVLALEQLLGTLSSKNENSTGQLRQSDSLAIVNVQNQLIEMLEDLKAKVENGVQRYLRIYAMCQRDGEVNDSLRKMFLPVASPRVKLLFYFELRLYMWLMVLTNTAQVLLSCPDFGTQRVKDQFLSQGELLAKIWKKVRKLRVKLADKFEFIEADLREAERKLVDHLRHLERLSDEHDDNEDIVRTSNEDNLSSDVREPPSVLNVSVVGMAVDALDKERDMFETKQEVVESFIDEILKTGGAFRSSDLSQKCRDDDLAPPVETMVKEKKRVRFDSMAERATERSRRVLEDREAMLSVCERREQDERKKINWIPSLPEEVNGDERKASKEIERNRGLIRQRKKTSGNARVSNRHKYEKKLRKLSGGRLLKAVDMVDGSGGYGGESSGIAMHVTRSRKIHS